ncbi:hypothetical protein O6H91_11G117600 [Diphasiastrum complanatum]|uniref:Uncharacterized protein n=1 Tax=Diphasiastrum complanatum TaxID=34168 RepID=A0ACC2CDL2_DIPCM|nr:hypothetical protein O6H91_11G117600 [Diphasiastrum complanatum]
MTAFLSSRAGLSDIHTLHLGSSIRYCHLHHSNTFPRLPGVRTRVLGALDSSDKCGSQLCNRKPYVKARQYWGTYRLFLAGFNVNLKGFGGRRWQHSVNHFKIPLQSLLLEIEQKKSHVRSVSEIPVTVQQEKPALQTGALIEFERDNGNIVLAVADQPFGKKNWIAQDQHRNVHSIRFTQISYVIPGVEDFKPAQISNFLEKSVALQDPSLLEPAWEELSATGVTSMDAKVLAKVLFGTTTPEECYAAHCLLSSNQVFFRCNQKGKTPMYAPRPLTQVNELRERHALDEVARRQLDVYVNAVRKSMSSPSELKPAKSGWHSDEFFSKRTDALKALSLESCFENEQKKLALQVLASLGMSKTPTSAVDVLIGMGIFPAHVNVELLKSRIRIDFSNELLAAAELIRNEPFPDIDLDRREDLTSLNVYTIDSDDTKEIDDGLSASLLPDGRIKLWVHVADPTRWINPEHLLEKEARQRGTSVYLPTQTIPMFPMGLAADCMSLKQGHNCAAITISVVLKEDGSIEESQITCSTIRPTHKLSYYDAHSLILRKDETDLNMLSYAATLRHKWRKSKGAVEPSPTTRVKVSDAESIDPCIEIEVFDHTNLAVQLVSEMMILCGEAVSMFGDQQRLLLPYRGQIPRDLPSHSRDITAEGAGKDMALRRTTGPVGINLSKPVGHSSLGLSGYVQFTSPIRRYTDFIAHYQVKAALRGDKPFFAHGYLEAAIGWANLRSREAKRLEGISNRYWILEYLRRQPKDTIFQAVVMRFVKDHEAFILLKEVGLEALVTIHSKASAGDKVKVIVKDAHPRKDLLLLKEIL